MNRKTRLKTILLMVSVTSVSVLLFIVCYLFDNKYTRPRPQANMGVVRLDGNWYGGNPMFYLVDGWSFYQGRLLSPDQIGDYAPDAYFYIGRYGGFDLGDPSAAPYGMGTYRTVILTAGPEQEYALEMTPVYSRWRLWVNGTLKQSVGMGEPNLNQSMSSVTFTARERIEIVVEAEDHSHFYSGMVYPPAFGAPELVARTSALRLLIHAAGCAVAFFIGILCLIIGGGSRFSRPYGLLALLCLCFFGSTAWPVFQVVGRGLDTLLVLERFCYYGIGVSMMWIQGNICRLPRKACLPSWILGGAVCLSTIFWEFFPVTAAWQLYAYGNLLTAFKWFAAAWLLGASAWAVYRRAPYSLPMLAGNCVFAAALIMDRCFPFYEPIFTGWFVEIAGAVLILLVAGIISWDMLRAFKEKITLQMEQKLSRAQLEAREKYAALQQDYVIRTRKQLHETRNRYTLLKHYADLGELDQLREYLKEIFPSLGISAVTEYTGHSLIDAILSVQTAQAVQDGIYMEVDGDRLTGALNVTNNDITALLMNLLNNAVEACGRLPADGERWIYLELKLEDKDLVIRCANSADPAKNAERGTNKADKLAHGYGLSVMREVAQRYGGSLETEKDEDSFRVEIRLKDVAKEQNPMP
ncbi:MAG: GHKL domain-containing protein [Clostridium sp.]|nr:GHKL domain-containing protein [Clostridium sp.]